MSSLTIVYLILIMLFILFFVDVTSERFKEMSRQIEEIRIDVESISSINKI